MSIMSAEATTSTPVKIDINPWQHYTGSRPTYAALVAVAGVIAAVVFVALLAAVVALGLRFFPAGPGYQQRWCENRQWRAVQCAHVTRPTTATTPPGGS
jgi:hypothetical protein